MSAEHRRNPDQSILTPAAYLAGGRFVPPEEPRLTVTRRGDWIALHDSEEGSCVWIHSAQEMADYIERAYAGRVVHWRYYQ